MEQYCYQNTPGGTLTKSGFGVIIAGAPQVELSTIVTIAHECVECFTTSHMKQQMESGLSSRQDGERVSKICYPNRAFLWKHRP
jgi:hypothetical protein